MRGAGVHGEADAAEGGVNQAVELGEALVWREDAADDDARVATGREAGEAFDREGEDGDLGGGLGEAGGDLGEEIVGGVGNFADEFDGDVVLGGWEPAEVCLGLGAAVLQRGVSGEDGRGGLMAMKRRMRRVPGIGDRVSGYRFGLGHDSSFWGKFRSSKGRG